MKKQEENNPKWKKKWNARTAERPSSTRPTRDIQENTATPVPKKGKKPGKTGTR